MKKKINIIDVVPNFSSPHLNPHLTPEDETPVLFPMLQTAYLLAASLTLVLATPLPQEAGWLPGGPFSACPGNPALCGTGGLGGLGGLGGGNVPSCSPWPWCYRPPLAG